MFMYILGSPHGSRSYVPGRKTVCNFSSLPNMRKRNAYCQLLYQRYEYYIMNVYKQIIINYCSRSTHLVREVVIITGGK